MPSATAQAELSLWSDVRCGCRTRPDITDLPNPVAGPCVVCGRWVMKRAGWRVRGRGCWLGVSCDGHANPSAPPSPGNRDLVERAERLAARVRSGDVPAWVRRSRR